MDRYWAYISKSGVLNVKPYITIDEIDAVMGLFPEQPITAPFFAPSLHQAYKIARAELRQDEKEVSANGL